MDQPLPPSEFLPRLSLSDQNWKTQHLKNGKRRQVAVEEHNDPDGTRTHKFKISFNDAALTKFLGADAAAPVGDQDGDMKDVENNEEEHDDGFSECDVDEEHSEEGNDSGGRVKDKTKMGIEGKRHKRIIVSLADRTDKGPKDAFSSLLSNAVIAVEIGCYIQPEDILTLYSVSRDFHTSVRSYLLSSILRWIGHRAPEAGRTFPFKIYLEKLVTDPEARTLGQHYPGKGIRGKPLPEHRRDEVRVVPGIKYMQMVLVRDRCCREITALLARNGHRTPRSMRGTLLRLWVLMDVPTTTHRRAILRSRDMWPNLDVYNVQLLLVKLALHFNDPLYGPAEHDLVRLFMGQRGLYPLWQLLTCRRYTTAADIMALKTRYDLRIPPDRRAPGERHRPRYVNGVPLAEVGIAHREGWGAWSPRHLLRPDELMPLEAIERGLDLHLHLRRMVDWGHIHHPSGSNRVPSEAEMYISDEERVLAHVDTTRHWKPKHARKKCWPVLTPEQRQAVVDEDEDERLRLLAWAGAPRQKDIRHHQPENGDSAASSSSSEDDNSTDSGHDSETYDLNDEIDRGLILPDPSFVNKLKRAPIPRLGDEKGWTEYTRRLLMTTTITRPDQERAGRSGRGRSQDVELRNQSLRAHVNMQRDERPGEDLREWHEWLKTPQMAEAIRTSMRQSAAQNATNAAATVPAAEAAAVGEGSGPGNPPDQIQDQDGDVEMGEG